METRLAKISRPTSTGLLARERLFKALDEGRRYPVVSVIGPAGSGKTMLVSGYLETRGIQCAWYRIDEGDDDPATFFYYLNLLAKQTLRVRKFHPPFMPEHYPGFRTYALRFFESLLARVKPPFTVVFDNYQLLTPSSPVHDIIATAASIVPDKCNIFLLSRSDIPPQFVPLKTLNKTWSLGWEDLRFTRNESTALLRLIKSGRRLPASRLYRITGGWVAGLILMAYGAGVCNSPDGVDGEPGLQEVFNYFAVEVFNGLYPALQEFLLATSFLPSMTAGQAADLTGNSDSEKILRELKARNCFTESYFRERRTYLYHPLFRDFLRSTALQRLDGEAIREVRRKAAQVLVRDHFENALALLRDAEDWETAVPLMLNEAPTLLSQARFQTLRDWLLAVPEDIRDSFPWLTYWLAVSTQAFDPHESTRLFERAFADFERRKDLTGQLLSWAGGIDSAHLEAFQVFRRVSSRVMDPWIAWMERYLKNEGGFPSETVEGHVAASMAGALLVRRPHDPSLAKWVERSLSIARTVSEEKLSQRVFGFAIGFYNMTGDYRRSLTLLEEMNNRVALPTTVFSIGNETNHALIYNQFLSPPGLAEKAVEKGLRMAEESGIHLWTPMLLAQGAYAAISRGDLREASRYLEQMEPYMKGAPILVSCQYYQMSALKAVMSGDIATGIRCSQEQLRLAIEIDCPWIVAACHLHLSLVLLDAGELGEARKELAAFAHLPQFSSILSYSYLLVKSGLELKDGNHPSAVQHLRKALALGRKNGYANMFYWWDPRFMTALYAVALKQGIETEYVCEIIKTRNIFPDTLPLDVDGWPWPFRVYTLGSFRLMRNDEPLAVEGRSHKKPLMLLKALIALGGRDVPETSLTDLLWPDASGDAAHDAYTTTLSRLRHLLGSEKVIEVQGGKASLSPRHFWVDTWLFQELCHRVDIRKKDHHLGEMIEQALDLYKGDFLSLEDDFWTISPREGLRVHFLKLVEQFGDLLDETGETGKAIDCYEKALAIDDSVEEFYQRLMKCHEKEGRFGEAVKVYLRCMRTLEGKLGTRPSERTETMYRAVREKV